MAEDMDLVHDFVNTLDRRGFREHGVRHAGADAFAAPAGLAAWLHAYGLLGPAEPVTGADRDAAVALRAALRTALARDPTEPPEPPEPPVPPVPPVLPAPSGPPGPPEPSGLPGPALPGTFSVRVGPAGPELVPAGSGAVRALGAVQAAAVRLAATGRWRRLKMCPDPECRWVFEDRSRSGRGRWCATERCGNRAKTRAYRERSRRASTPVEPG
jgi:hypothetical protein